MMNVTGFDHEEEMVKMLMTYDHSGDSELYLNC